MIGFGQTSEGTPTVITTVGASAYLPYGYSIQLK